MANQDEFFKKVVAHAKEYGFIFPSSEIYDGLAAVYDYGQLGVELKNNIKQAWWKAMVQMHENIVGLDSAIFMHPRIWKASGHVDAFNDPLIDNKDSKKRYRADVLIEDHIAKIEEKIEKECEKAHKRFGDAFDRQQFVTTNARVLEHQKQIDEIHERYADCMNRNDLDGLKQLILDLGIVCPISGTRNWTDVRQFNLMFATKMGSVIDDSDTLYLRPETAQGIFVNFLNVQKSGRMKIPFGIAQIGKAFRNEIVARQFIFRMREFEQMEMQFFVRPGTELEWFKKWKEERLQWHLSFGIPADCYRYHDHEKLAHYANAATDIEFKFPFGFKELEGIHSRTDFDLSRHSEFSGKKLQYFDSELNESYTPRLQPCAEGGDAGGRQHPHGAEPAHQAGSLQGRRASARQEGRPARESPRGAAPAHARHDGAVRREGRHRPPLPSSGRYRHPLLHHRRQRHAQRQRRHRASPRHHAAGARRHRPAAGLPQSQTLTATLR